MIQTVLNFEFWSLEFICDLSFVIWNFKLKLKNY